MFKMLPRIVANLFQKPATRAYPSECRIAYEHTRGKVEFEVGECKFCGSCAKICPTNALEVSRKDKSVTFETFKCISCGACIDACRYGSILMGTEFRSASYDKPVETHTRTPETVVEATSEKEA